MTNAPAPEILPARLMPPRRGASIVRRPRLNGRLDAAFDRHVIVICAPAGFGKSTLAADWLDEAGLPSVWLTLDIRLADARALAQYLVTAVRGRYPGALRSLATGDADVMRDGPAGFVARFVAEVAQIDASFALVLDDVHALEQAAEVMELIDTLAVNAPLNLRVVLVTRSTTGLQSLSRMIVEQRAYALVDDELAFSLDEAEALLDRAGVTDSDRQAQVIRRAGGWAAALAVLSQHAGETAASDMRAPSGAFLDDFIDREILSRLTRQEVALLEVCAVLGSFDVALASEVGGADVTGLLHRVERATHLITELEERAWYRVHALLAARVVARMEEGAQERLQALRRRAAAVARRRGRYEQAIELATEARAWDDVVEIVLAGERRLLERRAWGTLSACLDRLPADVMSQQPDLVLLRVRTAPSSSGDAVAIRQLEALDPFSLNPRQLTLRALYRSKALRRLSRIPEAIRECRQAHLLARRLRPRDELLAARINLELGQALGMSGRLAHAERRLRLAAAAFQRRQELDELSAAENGIGNTCLLRGAPARALAHFELAARLALSTGAASLQLLALNNKAHAEYLIGDFAQARATLTGCLALAKRSADRMGSAHAEQTLGALEGDLGNLDRARTLLERAERTARSFDRPEIQAEVAYSLGETLWHSGEASRARAVFESALEAATRGGMELQCVQFQVRIAAVFVSERREDDARPLLQHAIRRARQLGLRSEQARAEFVLAAAVLGVGDGAAAAAALERVAVLATALEYDQFLHADARRWRSLCEFAADRGIGGGYFRRLLERLPPARPVHAQLPARSAVVRALPPTAGTLPARERTVSIELVRGLLEGFHDDDFIGGSALAAAVVAEQSGRASTDRVQAARALLLECLESPALRVAPQSRRTSASQHEILRAYYVDREGSHEQVAEQLDLTTSTYYRNLRRGLEALASVIQSRLDEARAERL